MARNWQLLLLAGALLSPAGAWAGEKNGEKQHEERWPREAHYGHGAVSAVAGFTRVWEDVVYGVYSRRHARDSEGEKEWRKEQKKREKERREAQREWEKEIAVARAERRDR